MKVLVLFIFIAISCESPAQTSLKTSDKATPSPSSSAEEVPDVGTEVLPEKEEDCKIHFLSDLMKTESINMLTQKGTRPLRRIVFKYSKREDKKDEKNFNRRRRN